MVLHLQVLGDKIYRPIDFVEDGNYSTLNERVRDIGWPTIDSMRGKFVIVLTRQNKGVYDVINALLAASTSAGSRYPTEQNMTFVSACAAYTGVCNASDISSSWAGKLFLIVAYCSPLSQKPSTRCVHDLMQFRNMSSQRDSSIRVSCKRQF